MSRSRSNLVHKLRTILIGTVALGAVAFFTFICMIWFRSRSSDEGFEYKRWVYYTDRSSDRETSLCWGPHGVRLWFWKDDHWGADDIRPTRTPPEVETQGVVFRSDPYKPDSSWGWPIESFWNRLGFWISHQHYNWEHQARRIFLVAAPFWFCALVALTVLSGAILSYRRISLKKR